MENKVALVTIHGKSYEPVEDRIVRFFKTYPEGRIIPELVVDDGKRFVVKTSIYRNFTDQVPLAVGHEEEIIGSSMINKTSALANCETGSIGRALANANFAKSGTPRPSAEEMTKVERLTNPEPFFKAIDNALDTEGLHEIGSQIKIAETTLDPKTVEELRKKWSEKLSALAKSEA